MGTFERQLAKDYIVVKGMTAAAFPLGMGLVALGLASAGFLMYNKVDDLKEWLSDGWEDGFGLTNDPTQTQEQVTNYISPDRTPAGLEGMSTSSIYSLHYQMRGDLMAYFSRMYCEYEGIEWTGPNDARFLRYLWSTSHLGSSSPDLPTFRQERVQVTTEPGSGENEISEYTYQMIIRETDSRNTQARVMSGFVGLASTGIGAAFSEATHWALRSSGFMRGTDGWNGQNWEEAPGANRDPLLNYAWARTDFKTGKWWSTVDSQGDVAYWLDVLQGGHGGARIETGPIGYEMENPFIGMRRGYWTYEQIIWYAHEEMSNGSIGPFILYLSEQGGLPLVIPAAIPPGETVDDTDPEPDQDPEAPDDDHMGPPDDSTNPDDDDPTKAAYWRKRNEQPPPGWQPS